MSIVKSDVKARAAEIIAAWAAETIGPSKVVTMETGLHELDIVDSISMLEVLFKFDEAFGDVVSGVPTERRNDFMARLRSSQTVSELADVIAEAVVSAAEAAEAAAAEAAAAAVTQDPPAS